MLMRSAGIVLLLLGVFVFPASAAFQDLLGFGTRAMGMGGSYVGVANDADAAVWNPAGLGLVRNIQLSAMYVKPYLNLGINMGLMSAAGAYPYPDLNGVIGGAVSDYDVAGLYKENIFSGYPDGNR